MIDYLKVNNFLNVANIWLKKKETKNLFQDGTLTISVWGKQIPRRPLTKMAYSRLAKSNFTNVHDELATAANNLADGFKMNGRSVDPSSQSLIVELILLKKQQQRNSQRMVSVDVTYSIRHILRDKMVIMRKAIVSHSI